MDHCTFPDEVNLFQKPCNNIAYQKIQYVDYKPSSMLSGGGPLSFTIPAAGSQYINLKKTYLYLKVRVVNGDGSAIEAGKELAPINLTLHSLFNQVDILLQQQLVSSLGSQTYAYKAYMETLLDYGQGAKDSQLQAQGYYKDWAGRMEDVEMDAEELERIVTEGKVSNGSIMRRLLYQLSNTQELFGPLMADICQQDRLILNGVEIQMKLWPSNNAFRLVTTEDDPSFQMEIVDATLKVCKVTPTPTLLVAHSAALKESNAIYPYQRTQIKTFNVPGGQQSFLLDDLYQGQVPSRLVIGMVISRAFSGSYDHNAFNMERFGINSLGVYVNNECASGKPLQMEARGYDAEAYYDMFVGVNRDGQDWGNGIRLEDFTGGYALFVFDLLPGDQPALERANLRIEGVFAEALVQNITVIVYGKFPAALEITESRSVLL